MALINPFSHIRRNSQFSDDLGKHICYIWHVFRFYIMMDICSRISQVCVKGGLITIAREQMGHFISHCLFVCVEANVPVNNFSVMSGRSQLFLGLTSAFLLKDTTR